MIESITSKKKPHIPGVMSGYPAIDPDLVGKPKKPYTPLAGAVEPPERRPVKLPPGALAGSISAPPIKRPTFPYPQILAGKVLMAPKNDADMNEKIKILKSLNEAIAQSQCQTEYKM